MKKYTRLFIYTLLLCAVSCTNEINVQLADAESEDMITLEKDQYAPYEVVSLKCINRDPSNKNLVGKISDVEVELVIGDSSATFVMPSLPDGNHILTFSSGSKEYQAQTVVKNLTQISTPEVYFKEIETSLNGNIEFVTSMADSIRLVDINLYETLKLDSKKYSDLLEDYRMRFNNLSTKEKQEFAICVAANKTLFDEYRALTNALVRSSANLRTAQGVIDYEREVKATTFQYLTSLSGTVKYIPIIAALVVVAFAPNPYIAAGAIVALGFYLVNFLSNGAILIAVVGKLINVVLRPFQNLHVTGELNFEAEQETPVVVAAVYRSTSEGEENDPFVGKTISGFNNSYNPFRTKYNSFIKSLPAIIRPSSTLPALNKSFKTAIKNVYNKYIKMSNVSNPNVSVIQLDQADGSIKLKASNKSTVDQDFSFQIEYNNSDFTNGLKNTLYARVKSAMKDSVEIYRQATLGLWTETYYDRQLNTEHVTFLSFLEDGKGVSIYTYDDGTPGTDTFGWYIFKENGRYFLSTNIKYSLFGKSDHLSFPLKGFNVYDDKAPYLITREYVKNM